MRHLDEAGFLNAVVRSPDADGPRLAYADWLDERDDPRGQFIRLQCLLAQLPEGERPAHLLQLQDELLTQHGENWAVGVLKSSLAHRFHRGFVETLVLTPSQLRDSAEIMAAKHPVRCVRLMLDQQAGGLAALSDPNLALFCELELTAGYLGDGLAAPLAARDDLRLSRLDLSFNSLTDQGLSILARAGWLRSLQTLSLAANAGIGSIGLRRFLDAENLTSLTRLDLSEIGLQASSLQVVLDSNAGQKLERIDLGGNRLSDAGLQALGESEVMLRILTARPILNIRGNGIRADGIAALADSPLAELIEDLDLSGNPLGDAGLHELARSWRFRRLRRLNLRDTRVVGSGWRRLASAEWFGLLCELDLRDNLITRATVDHLRTYFFDPGCTSNLQLLADPVSAKGFTRGLVTPRYEDIDLESG